MCQSLFFNKVTGLRPVTLFKKKTVALVFSCKFWGISKNTFFTEQRLLLFNARDIFAFSLLLMWITGTEGFLHSSTSSFISYCTHMLPAFDLHELP